MYDKNYQKFIWKIFLSKNPCQKKKGLSFTAAIEKELSDIQEDNDSLIKSYLLDKGHVWFDFYRNMAMLKAGQLFPEADKVGCYDLSTNSGCIYLDADMIITEKLGVYIFRMESLFM